MLALETPVLRIPAFYAIWLPMARDSHTSASDVIPLLDGLSKGSPVNRCPQVSEQWPSIAGRQLFLPLTSVTADGFIVEWLTTSAPLFGRPPAGWLKPPLHPSCPCAGRRG